MSVAFADPGPFDGAALAFVSRARAAGGVRRRLSGAYLLPDALAEPARRAGLRPSDAGPQTGAQADAAKGDVLPPPPRIALYRGAAVGYPYWAYYAHALLSVGLVPEPVDAEAILAGALDRADCLVMPGGFATWGLDRAEQRAHLDAAVRSFIDGGGAYVGSCGGAYYASSGRPGWLDAFPLTPRYTQEYLSTGAGLVSVRLGSHALAQGLPPAIEMPYYHGPVYDRPDWPAAEDGPAVAGAFRSLVAPSRLFIDNPLSAERFAEMADRPAILARRDVGGRFVVFSPHPEMGEFVRKGIALDGYVRHYLPIRGTKVMDETLRFYMADESAGFRLIANAVDWLCPQGARGEAGDRPAPAHDPLDRLDPLVACGLAALDRLARQETAEMEGLVRRQAEALSEEWARLRDPLATASGRSAAAIVAVLDAAADDAGPDFETRFAGARLAEALVLCELPVRLASVARRCLLLDAQIAEGSHA
ncbi:hypothetical protein NPA31_012210 [Aurantimonas sp. MSK8Z-1]|uniref:BPL-N domain-containing protein n=1 Tax=Mangrovibrevibacter kandeliae TaxID=2968473 RepID=UPI0021180F6B|nr:BPL-N domain-containing protein [Aurantimonas sp. MSK8Z-1]MCW4115726.1 hypothetical protein [Aurantimonas sp. MSK8Z-1]